MGIYHSLRYGSDPDRSDLSDTFDIITSTTITEVARFANASMAGGSELERTMTTPDLAYSTTARLQRPDTGAGDFITFVAPAVGGKRYDLEIKTNSVVPASGSGSATPDTSEFHDYTIMIPDASTDAALVLIDGVLTNIEITSTSAGTEPLALLGTGATVIYDIERITVASITDTNTRVMMAWINFLRNNIRDDAGHDVPTDWFMEEVPVEMFDTIQYPIGIIKITVTSRRSVGLGGVTTTRDAIIIGGTITLSIQLSNDALDKQETQKAIIRSIVDEIVLRIDRDATDEIPSLVSAALHSSEERFLDTRSQIFSQRAFFAISHIFTAEII